VTASEDGSDEALAVRILRLDTLAHGIAWGLVVGLGIFIATTWLMLKGGGVVGPHLALLGQFLPGYEVTLAGSLIGLGYGLVCGFAAGSLVSMVYNRVAARRRAGG